MLRYVHRNPVRAGICKSISDYKWSSNYFYERNRRTFIYIDNILDMISSDRNKAIEIYIKYMNDNEEDGIGFDEKKIIGDDAYEIMMSTRAVIPVRKRLDEILIDTGCDLSNYLRKTRTFISMVEKLTRKSIHNSSGKIKKYGVWGLFIFVAVQLPGTG